MGLLARALEMHGIATTQTSWNPGITRLVNPPRATVTRLNRGATLGEPGDAAQQRRVLAATLVLLEEEAPLEIVRLDEAPNGRAES